MISKYLVLFFVLTRILTIEANYTEIDKKEIETAGSKVFVRVYFEQEWDGIVKIVENPYFLSDKPLIIKIEVDNQSGAKITDFIFTENWKKSVISIDLDGSETIHDDLTINENSNYIQTKLKIDQIDSKEVRSVSFTAKIALKNYLNYPLNIPEFSYNFNDEKHSGMAALVFPMFHRANKLKIDRKTGAMNLSNNYRYNEVRFIESKNLKKDEDNKLFKTTYVVGTGILVLVSLFIALKQKRIL